MANAHFSGFLAKSQECTFLEFHWAIIKPPALLIFLLREIEYQRSLQVPFQNWLYCFGLILYTASLHHIAKPSFHHSLCISSVFLILAHPTNSRTQGKIENNQQSWFIHQPDGYLDQPGWQSQINMISLIKSQTISFRLSLIPNLITPQVRAALAAFSWKHPPWALLETQHLN